ncbi:prepilin-type N-terminal cleavage/methylation domain-containing protein [Candidatus Zixiibacteriota bacterium]
MNNKGISILEVMVAMIVLTIGLLGVAPMIVLSIKGNSISRDTMVSSKLAKEIIEHYESLDSLPSIPFETSEKSRDDIYNVKVNIQDNTTDKNIPTGVYEIKVVVNWEDEAKLPKIATYSTYMRKGAIHVYN